MYNNLHILAMSIIQKIKNLANEVSTGMNEFYSHFINGLIEASEKCKDLRKTNIDLAEYHFSNANFNDAIFRYLILIRIFKLETEEIFYNIGLACYLNDSKTKALSFFKKAYQLNPKNKLCKFRIESIESPESIDTVPIEIITQDFDKIASKYGRMVLKNKYVAPEILIKNLSEFISRHEDISKYTCDAAIEMGSGYGVCGYLAKTGLNIKKIYGVDISSKMIDEADKLNATDNIFQKFYNEDFLNFDKYTTHFDLVIACFSLQFTRDLKPFFKKFKSISNKNAYLAFAVPHSKSNKTCYNENIRQMEYATEDIEAMIKAEKLHNFEISLKDISSACEAVIVVIKK